MYTHKQEKCTPYTHTNTHTTVWTTEDNFSFCNHKVA